MYSNSKPILTCIPENEAEDENLTIKWVPKKKHEVLKAKYKCLKKLFQIYDASLIGMLPTGYEEGDSQYVEVQAEGKHRRKKHSHRTRTNAQTGTSEEYSTETGTEELPSSQSLITTTQVINQSEDNLSVVESERSQITAITQSTQSTNENVSQIQLVHSRSCQDYGVGGYDSFDPRIRGHRLSQSMPMDIFYRHDRMRRTRFQAFINRIFGIRSYPSMYVIPDKNLTDRYGEKRTRRGIRFGRSRRPKKAIMPYNATDLNSPVILDYIQSVQRSCLTDRTPRQCPIVGCRMIYYGIINYNDHLNLCHFPERKFICHYCHEGFESETDKILHENEHLGLNKLNIAINIPQPVMSNVKIARQTNCDIQTENNDLAAEKLKKIVSLFDKIVESDQINDEIKKKRFSDSNIQQKSFDTTSSTVQSMGKQTLSLTRTVHPSSVAVVNPKCHVCGESFDNRTQLNLHVNYEHRAHAKFSKFHSCAGIVNVPKKTIDLVSKDGQINVESVARNSFGVIQSTTTIPSKKTKSESQGSAQDLNSSCFSASTLTKKPSTISSILNTMKTSMYKWEPGTKIINV